MPPSSGGIYLRLALCGVGRRSLLYWPADPRRKSRGNAGHRWSKPWEPGSARSSMDQNSLVFLPRGKAHRVDNRNIPPLSDTSGIGQSSRKRARAKLSPQLSRLGAPRGERDGRQRVRHTQCHPPRLRSAQTEGVFIPLHLGGPG